VSDQAPPERSGPKKGKFLQYGLHVAVLVGVAMAGLKYINGDAFLKALQRFSWEYAPLILALSVGYVLVKGWRFVFLMRQFTDASRWMILRAYVAGQACTLLPGGMAARAALLDQVKIPVSDSAASIALSSFSDQAVLLACSLLAAFWFKDARGPALYLLAGLAVISIVLGVEATRTWLLRLIERLLGKFKLLDQWRGFLRSLGEVTTVPVVLGGVANAALAFALYVIALDLAMRGVGAKVPYATLLLAFTLPTMLGRISAMPGGVGVTETGMIGILNHAPGVSLDQAAAAVTVFRLGTVVFAAVFGGLVYLFGWRGTAEVKAT
jgi:uncharacterized protein (TIRG00374 family)